MKTNKFGKPSETGNKISMLLVFGLMIFLALGCSFNVGKNAENTTETDKPTPEKKDDDKKEKKEVEKSDASEGEVPSDEEAQELAKETLLEFNKAVQEGDFSDFHDSISKVWKKEITPKKFEEAFAEFIDKKIDISQISSMDADFSPEPEVKKEQGYDMLNLEGSYDTSPVKTRFELKYVPEGKDWKLSRIRVVLR